MLLLIKEEGPVGRYFISREFVLPEGMMRGVLSTLQKKGIVHTSKEGCTITEMGGKLISKTFQILKIKNIKTIDFDFLAMDKFCAVAHISKGQGLFGATSLRDKVVRAGASGAIILVYDKGRFVIPNVYTDLASVNPFLVKKLKNEFFLVDNDMLISAFAPRVWKAKEAAIFATLN
jgi:predicted transcriptional regulator